MKKNKKHAPSVNFKSLGKTIKLMYQGNEVTSILVIGIISIFIFYFYNIIY